LNVRPREAFSDHIDAENILDEGVVLFAAHVMLRRPKKVEPNIVLPEGVGRLKPAPKKASTWEEGLYRYSHAPSVQSVLKLIGVLECSLCWTAFTSDLRS
jgi:hypothetical protein